MVQQIGKVLRKWKYQMEKLKSQKNFYFLGPVGFFGFFCEFPPLPDPF